MTSKSNSINPVNILSFTKENRRQNNFYYNKKLFSIRLDELLSKSNIYCEFKKDRIVLDLKTTGSNSQSKILREIDNILYLNFEVITDEVFIVRPDIMNPNIINLIYKTELFSKGH